MILEKNAPFKSRQPVSPEILESRIKIIDDYTRYLPSAVIVVCEFIFKYIYTNFLENFI